MPLKLAYFERGTVLVFTIKSLTWGPGNRPLTNQITLHELLTEDGTINVVCTGSDDDDQNIEASLKVSIVAIMPGENPRDELIILGVTEFKKYEYVKIVFTYSSQTGPVSFKEK